MGHLSVKDSHTIRLSKIFFKIILLLFISDICKKNIAYFHSMYGIMLISPNNHNYIQFCEAYRLSPCIIRTPLLQLKSVEKKWVFMFLCIIRTPTSCMAKHKCYFTQTDILKAIYNLGERNTDTSL